MAPVRPVGRLLLAPRRTLAAPDSFRARADLSRATPSGRKGDGGPDGTRTARFGCDSWGPCCLIFLPRMLGGY